ncbi:Dihydroorotate dehydrogenase (quinone), mitochondrial [Frankliniella fusca]|uniref:Dihydroorotate dehydrogenase (Quinone), mitochondrial n=1 Tax=Frankliniella fusca TaxID=407009 RepID=A0AAE1GYZ6_9NEOP|nr:Dihydroorotate dehydrogenase (quinone), mitochondrial [Frankliniella fusca]
MGSLLPSTSFEDSLRNCPEISDATIKELISQEVTAELFFKLNEDDLRINFPTITFGQRKILVNFIKVHYKDAEQTSSAVTSNVAVSNDLGLSSSVIDAAANGSAPSSRKRKISARKQLSEDDVEPLDVLAILNNVKNGQAIVAKIRESKFIEKKQQQDLMHLLHSHVLVGSSPQKYYPHRETKISVAKGIVQAFPELKDQDTAETRPWASWLRKFEVKCETVRAALPHEKKRPRLQVSAVSKTNNSAAKCSASSVNLPGPSRDKEVSSLAETMRNWMKQTIPTRANRPEIEMALASTYEERRAWINSTFPTCTEVLHKYHLLSSYKGDMISAEFSRMKQHQNFEEKFVEMAPYIWSHYVKRQKPDCPNVTLAENMFPDICVRALMILPRLLSPVLSVKAIGQEAVNHIKNKKNQLQQIPCAALIQIVPEGTDIESYVSEEYTGESIPVHPFLLWATNDRKSGEVYLKIDRQSLHVASFDTTTNNPIIRAAGTLVKASYVFNLKYHPYLRHFFQYIECVLGIGKATFLNVKDLNNALRAAM